MTGSARHSRRSRNCATNSLLVCSLLTAMALLSCATAAHGQYKLCFPLTTWFGSPTGPTIDGKVIGDPGWRGGFRYVFGNGTTIPYVVVQGIRDSSNNLYLSFEGESLPSLNQAADPSTVVELAFDFRSSGGQLQRISVKPVIPSPVIQTDPANIVGVDSGPVKFWLGSADVAGHATWSQVSPTPAWLLHPNNQVGYLQNPAGDYHWFLEMMLPITGNATPAAGITLPVSGTFGLYINVFRVVSGNYQESWWPPTTQAYENGCTSVGSCTPDTQTPDPGVLGASIWGTSTIDPGQSCGGVSVGSQNNDIFTNNSPNSKICITNNAPCAMNPNTFTANVHNTTIDGSGTFQPAPNVRATFLIANWGLSTQWTPISPVTNNPTSPVTLPLNSTTPLATGSWFPVPNPNNYDPTVSGSHPHQCIMVTLDSTSGNVDFTNNTAIQNMDFVHASKFQRTAEISAKGYAPRPDNPDGTHNGDQLFDLHLITSPEVLNPGQAQSTVNPPQTQAGQGKGAERGRVISQLTWIAEGCRHTGRFMTVDERKIELCDPVGGFGYTMQHAGATAVENWNVQLNGSGLEPVPGQAGTYQIHVPQDGVATVTTLAEPQEQHNVSSAKLAVFFDAGGNIPQGAFGSVFNKGFSLDGGLEYIATSHFSVEGIFGYHHFPAKIGADLNIYQFSADGKAYLTTGTIRPFVNGGIGGYKFSPGSTHFGGNVGGGVLYNFTSRFGLQGSYNFHVANTPGTATKWSAADLGFRFVF